LAAGVVLVSVKTSVGVVPKAGRVSTVVAIATVFGKTVAPVLGSIVTGVLANAVPLVPTDTLTVLAAELGVAWVMVPAVEPVGTTNAEPFQEHME
jgi:hypothetical protein